MNKWLIPAITTTLLVHLSGCSTDPVKIADELHHDQVICEVRAPDVSKDACLTHIQEARNKRGDVITQIFQGITTAVGSVMALAI